MFVGTDSAMKVALCLGPATESKKYLYLRVKVGAVGVVMDGRDFGLGKGGKKIRGLGVRVLGEEGFALTWC